MIAHKVLLYPSQEAEAFLQKQFEYARRDYNRQLETIVRGIQSGKVDLFNLKKWMDAVYAQAKKAPDFYDGESYHYPDIIGWNKKRVQAAAEDYLANPLNKPKYLKHSRYRKIFRLTSAPLDAQRFSVSEDHHLLLGGMHRIKMAEPLRFQTHPIACEISLRNDRYYASFLFAENLKPYLLTGKTAGVTVGSASLVAVADSDGQKVRFALDAKKRTRIHKRIRHLEKVLSHKEIGSAQYEKTRAKLMQAKRKEEDIIRNFVEQTSHTLVKAYDRIGIDDASTQIRLIQHAYAKPYLQEPFSALSNRLQSKAKSHGKTVVKVKDRRSSAPICSQCGERNRKTKGLSNRRWACPHCGAVHDSDLEGAERLCKEALKQERRI